MLRCGFPGVSPPPPSLSKRMSCLREGNQVGPGGEVPHEGRNGGEAESAGCLAKTGLPSYLDSFGGGGAAT